MDELLEDGSGAVSIELGSFGEGFGVGPLEGAILAVVVGIPSAFGFATVIATLLAGSLTFISMMISPTPALQTQIMPRVWIRDYPIEVWRGRTGIAFASQRL